MILKPSILYYLLSKKNRNTEIKARSIENRTLRGVSSGDSVGRSCHPDPIYAGFWQVRSVSPLTFLDLKIPWLRFLLCRSYWILSNNDSLVSLYSTSCWLGWECFIKNTSRQIDLQFVCLPVCFVCLFCGDEDEPRLKSTADQQFIVKLHSQLIFTFSFLRRMS